MRDLPALGLAGVLLLAAAVGAALASFVLWRFYPAIFQSDSAAHYTLARAIVEQGSLLPVDFTYNNQLILWRGSFGIAAALALGLTGYAAFAVGCTLTFSVAFVLVFLTIDELLGDWPRALFASVLWLLPLGISESDYLFGQQSHLVPTLIVLAVGVFGWKALDGGRREAWVCAVAVFAGALEAPTRTAMMMLPFVAGVVLLGRAAQARRLGLLVLAAAVLGMAANRILAAGHLVLGVQNVPLALYDRFIARTRELGAFFVDYYVGFFQFSGLDSRAGFLLLYAMKAAVLAAFVAFFVALALAWRSRLREDAPARATVVEWLGFATVLHCVIGWWLVASIEYGLDIRHMLWAPMLLKLLVILGALGWVGRHLGRPAGQAAVAAAAGLLVCSVFTMHLYPAGRTWMHDRAEANRGAAAYPRLQARMAETGLRNVYGTYWEVLRTEVFIPGAKAGSLLVVGGKVQYHDVLVPTSRRCVKGDVLYWLDTSVDSVIEAAVRDRGGRLLERVGTHAIHAGPPVWDLAGCPS